MLVRPEVSCRKGNLRVGEHFGVGAYSGVHEARFAEGTSKKISHDRSTACLIFAAKCYSLVFISK